MAGKGLMRTDYWNRVTGSVRIGDTRRDETVTDVEGFLLPYGQAGTVGLHLWGIAAGLSVTATADQPGLRVSAGSAIDAAGHLIVVSGGGVAVVDPDIDPADVANIPTVAVDTTGVILPTAADTGPRYLTVRYLEVSVEGLLGNSPALVHAPWLRLRDTTGFSDDGTDVVLARVTLDNGIVTALSAELRRLAGLPAGRLQLRRPITGTGAALTIEDVPAGELRAHPDGALDLTMLDTAGTPTRTALTLDPSGNIGIGATQPRRPLHVEGSEIHSGGPGGGFSFADRAVTSLVETQKRRALALVRRGRHRPALVGDRPATVRQAGNIGIGRRPARRPLHVEGRRSTAAAGRRVLLRRPHQRSSSKHQPPASAGGGSGGRHRPTLVGRRQVGGERRGRGRRPRRCPPHAGAGKETAVRPASGSFKLDPKTIAPLSAWPTTPRSGSGATPEPAGGSPWTPPAANSTPTVDST